MPRALRTRAADRKSNASRAYLPRNGSGCAAATVDPGGESTYGLVWAGKIRRKGHGRAPGGTYGRRYENHVHVKGENDGRAREAHRPEQRAGVTRRDLIRRGAIVGGTLLWVAPAIQSMAPKAFAQAEATRIRAVRGLSARHLDHDPVPTRETYTVYGSSPECCALPGDQRHRFLCWCEWRLSLHADPGSDTSPRPMPRLTLTRKFGR